MQTFKQWLETNAHQSLPPFDQTAINRVVKSAMGMFSNWINSPFMQSMPWLGTNSLGKIEIDALDMQNPGQLVRKQVDLWLRIEEGKDFQPDPKWADSYFYYAGTASENTATKTDSEVRLNYEIHKDASNPSVKKDVLEELEVNFRWALEHELGHLQRFLVSGHDARRRPDAKHPARPGSYSYAYNMPEEWDTNIATIVRHYNRLPPEKQSTINYKDLICTLSGYLCAAYTQAPKIYRRVVKALQKNGVILKTRE